MTEGNPGSVESISYKSNAKRDLIVEKVVKSSKYTKVLKDEERGTHDGLWLLMPFGRFAMM